MTRTAWWIDLAVLSRVRISVLLVALPLVCLAGSAANALPSPQRHSGRGGAANLGVGVSLGDPMGASVKYFMSANHALQWHFAWLPLHHGAGGISMDYLFHPVTIASSAVVDLVPYFGGGFGFALWAHGRHYRRYYPEYEDDVHFGLMLRMLGGLALHWKRVPLDTVLEAGWTPFLLETRPNRFGGAHGDVSFKIRYYF
jgi:hypothetical protein